MPSSFSTMAKNLAEVQQADGKGQHRDRQHPVLQLEQHGNLHKDQPQVRAASRRVKVDLQQPVGGVSTQQEKQISREDENLPS